MAWGTEGCGLVGSLDVQEGPLGGRMQWELAFWPSDLLRMQLLCGLPSAVSLHNTPEEVDAEPSRSSPGQSSVTLLQCSVPHA